MKKLWGGRFKKEADQRLKEFSYSFLTDGALLPAELRVNRAASVFIFTVLLGTLLIVLTAWLDTWLDVPGKTVLIGLISGLLAAAAAIYGFGPFQRFVERRVLGIPWPPAGLIPKYRVLKN